MRIFPRLFAFFCAVLVSVSVFGAALPAVVQAQSAPEVVVPLSPRDSASEALVPDVYSLGKVIEIVSTGTRQVEGFVQHYQVSRVELTSGLERGKQIDIEHAALGTAGRQKVDVGQTVIVVKITAEGSSAYYIADDYRLPALALVLALFLGLTLIFARKKGMTSVLGLAMSIGVIMFFVVPRIVAGGNPLVISLIGALVVMFVSMYLAHGFALRTTVALFSTALTFGFATLIAYLFVTIGHLYGLGSDEAIYLQLGSVEGINLRGLLLGGILFGTLGVLDDITTAQSALVEELKKANPAFTVKELYRRGISVGREHISSLVNTLFLAYAGASLPLFLLFTMQNLQPWWVILNSEIIAEEVVRTLVGSITLVIAVPFTTLIAAIVFANREVEDDTLVTPGGRDGGETLHGHFH